MGLQKNKIQVTTDEIGVILGMAQDACSTLYDVAPDSDACTSSYIVVQWLELLYDQVARKATAQVNGQCRLW